MKIFNVLVLAISLVGCQEPASEVRTQKSKDGWRLLVNGKPYMIKGMSYTPTAIGESSDDNTRRDWMVVDDNQDGINDYAYQSWIDKNHNNVKDPDETAEGDFALMKRMGVNTIRVYHHSSDDPALMQLNKNGSMLLNHKPNKELLRRLYADYGIRVAMGDLVGSYTVATGAAWEKGTDYKDSRQRANILKSIEVMVNTYKDEPYLLLWILGNENNYQQFTNTNANTEQVAYLTLVNEAAKLIKKLDGKHPVAVCHGGAQYIDLFSQYAPEVDIFGMNMYVYSTFEPLWQKIAHHFDRPVMLTEFGALKPIINNGKINESLQAEVHRRSWEDIAAHTAGGKAPGNSIGGFVFQFVDEWWFNGDKTEHNPSANGSGIHLEYNGVAAMGDGSAGSLARQLREVYFMYQDLWSKK